MNVEVLPTFVEMVVVEIQLAISVAYVRRDSNCLPVAGIAEASTSLILILLTFLLAVKYD